MNSSSESIDDWTNDVHQGDAVETLGQMPESSVHMAMCSPPYYGLRDYDVEGQLGLEETLDEYISELLDVASELRRVLRDDGSWWLNLGDSFAGSWGAQSKDETSNNLPQHGFPDKNPGRSATLRRKSKMLVPHRVAIGLQEQGWVLRSDVVWHKPNPMPHPVKDRCHEHKEYLFHLTPEPDYWWDLDAIREPHAESSLGRTEHSFESAGSSSQACPREDARDSVLMDADDALHPNGKNPGDVWEVPVRPFPEAHFAVYPPELCERPIKSSCPEEVCAECGSPRRRETEEVYLEEQDVEEQSRDQRQRALEIARESDLGDEHFEALRAVGITDADYGQVQIGTGRNRDEVQQLAGEALDVLGSYAREFTVTETRTVGWDFPCDCDTDETEPGIVLDPFAGAGTTCLVAKRLGRRFVGIDLNPEYVAMAQKRVGVTVDEPDRLLEDDETALTAFADGGGR